jgi:DNA transformation protein
VTADDIVDLFSAFGPVSVRRMFGGAGIYADGTMFALVSDRTIYLKVGDSNRAAFECENLPPFTYATASGKRGVMSYRGMPARLYDDPEELAVWARAALAAAQQPRPRKTRPEAGGRTSKLKRGTRRQASKPPSARSSRQRRGRPR